MMPTRAARTGLAGRSIRVGVLLAVSMSPGCGAARSDLGDLRHRSVIVIDIDTLRADALGAYGYTRDTSPVIDGLAAESFVFTAAFSQAPTTLPSQASIFTGLYPRAHGATFRDRVLDPDVRTAAQVYAERGYRTAAFVDGGFMNRRYGHARGYETYRDTPGGRGLADIVPEALQWLRQHSGGPFFLVVHGYDVHTPYSPPEPFRSMFVEDVPPPTRGFEPNVDQMEAVREAVPGDPSRRLPPRDLAFARARYDGGVRYADSRVGDFLDGLREMGLLDEIILVLLSDHGEEFQEHGSVLHEKLYGTVTRIPLLVRLPDGRPRGRIPTTVEGIDVLPTLLDLTHSEILADVHGRSFVPAMREAVSAVGGFAFGESPFFGDQRYLVHDGYRVIWTLEPESYELYDMKEDPLEQRDLSAADPATLQRMLLSMDALDRYGESPAQDAIQLSPDVLRELRALGYIR